METDVELCANTIIKKCGDTNAFISEAAKLAMES
jgi:hypothetical protein